jgi:hypothetical protein
LYRFLTAAFLAWLHVGWRFEPGFDWLDRYRHGSAKDRTAPPPSLLATPSRLCVGESVLVHFNFIIPNANLGWNTGNTATTTCYPTRVSPCRQGIAKRPASAVPTSHWPTNKPLFVDDLAVISNLKIQEGSLRRRLNQQTLVATVSIINRNKETITWNPRTNARRVDIELFSKRT